MVPMTNKIYEIYLGLGSNELNKHLDHRNMYLDDAIGWLKIISDFKESSRIETDPVGFLDQPKFINSVIRGETDYSPRELLDFCLQTEKIMGRHRIFKNGPRKIDIDILFYGQEIIKEEGLIIPHPLLHQRDFVLQPLAEIAPNFLHPILKKTISEILRG